MIRHARRLSPVLVALLVGALLAVAVPAGAPGDTAPPTTASFTAQDLSWHVTGDTSSSSVTIAAGGTVTFGYPSGRTRHNADFAGGPAPATCTQTAGTQGGTPPPLPTVPTVAGWSGTCRFDAPGTYAFHCDMHPTIMHGTIVVVDPNAPPPTTPGGTTTSPTPTAPGGGTSPSSTTPTAPTGSPPRVRASVARVQRGTVLRGAVTTPIAHSLIVVTALASNRALAVHPLRHVRRVRVGSQRERSTVAGRTAFSVTLSAAARDALRRRRHLALELRIVVTPPGRAAIVRTVAVVLRARRAPAPAASAY